MIKRTDYHRKGSVIVMVVGLLVMLAMVGTTFIIVAHMDRREAAAIATAAPMKQVAGGLLQQIRVKLAADLHIDASGVIYGLATDYKQQVDCPHEDYDKHLASFAPVDMDGDGIADTWRHISNHNGVAGFVNVPTDDNSLVDTDGWAYLWDVGQNAWVLKPAGTSGSYAGDAKLFDSGVSNRAGKKYWVAVRIIDASALMNVNSAYGPPAAAAAGTVMPITNMSLEALTNTATRDNVHDARNGSTADNIAAFNTNYVQRPLDPAPAAVGYLPFDASDMTALLWGGTVPNTASGRLWEALGGGVPFDAAKSYLTVFSSSRDYIRRATGIQDMTHRIDLNLAGFDDLFKAFYNAIPAGVPGMTDGASNAERDAKRRSVAAQLAANVIDYRDGDDTPYQPTVAEIAAAGLAAGTTLFGVERQPFITEAWLRMEWDAAVPPGSVKQWSAIELFNPYKTDIDLTGYQLKVGAGAATAMSLPPGGTLPAGERFVIASNTAEIQAANKCLDNTLDLRQTCTLFRPASGGSPAPVGSVEFAQFGLTTPIAAGPAVHAAIRRDDAVARAKYSVAVYKTYAVTYRIGDAGCPTAGATNLGRSNVDPLVGGEATIITSPPAVPTPVFVRNGSLINLGEFSRIFYIGPSDDGTPLDEALASMAPNNVSNGRLYTFGAIHSGGWGDANIPAIPPICMLGDYMDALIPDPANIGGTDTVYGRININTAPWQVVQHLPGISALTTAIGGGKMLRERVARDIVAYRDLLDNTAIGGHNYSTGGAHITVTGLPHLRLEAGFASPGEVAIPLAKIVTPNNNYGSSAPNCYRISDGDDGLDDITDDLSKRDIYYAWLSNQITVRSDVYIAYIRVQIGDDPLTTGAVRKYVAVIDRSGCTTSDDLPDVVMFAEMK